MVLASACNTAGTNAITAVENLSVASFSSSKLTQMSGVNNSLSNFGFPAMIVVRVIFTSLTSAMVFSATPIASATVRFAEADAVVVPLLMETRSAVESTMIGSALRSPPSQDPTVVLRVRVSLVIWAMAARTEAPSVR